MFIYVVGYVVVIVILHEAVRSSPIAPVCRRQCKSINGKVKRVADAPHRDACIRALKLLEAWQQNALYNEHFGRTENHEQRRDERGDFRPYVHGFKLNGNAAFLQFPYLKFGYYRKNALRHK
jgi:hypothetical protein